MNQILISMFSGLISAAAASVVVVFFTTAKLRKERRFDRRLEWCESMMRAINAAGTAVFSASTGHDARARERCWSEAIRLYEELIPLCGLKEIYAPEDAIEHIRAFMHGLETLIKAHLDGDRRGPLSNDYELCLTQLRNAAASLSNIARSHLGLEALCPPDPKGYFSGSFRGQDLGEHGNPFMKDWTPANELRILIAREPESSPGLGYIRGTAVAVGVSTSGELS
jgi:hypothetical protein